MNKRELLSYLQTFFITLLIVTLVIVMTVWVTKNNSEKIPTPSEIKEQKDAQIHILIEQYKYHEKLQNKNYIINIKPGLLYETQGELKQAENEYKKSLNKVPYGIYEPHFMLADLYSKQNKFNNALALIDNIKEYPDASLINSKAMFYSKIANRLYEEKLYNESIRQYLNSLYYQEKTTTKKTDVLNELPKVYLALADKYIAEKKLAKAMLALEEGIRITSSPELMYKLAAIGMNEDPETSLELLEEVARIDPTIIDYNLYKQVLTNLIKKSEKSRDYLLAKSYYQKYKLVSKFAENNIIAPDDFKLEVLNSKYHSYPLKLREYIDFSFVIRNNSPTDATKLYAQIKIFNNNELIQVAEKRIATPYNILRKGRTTPEIKIKTRFIDKDNFIVTPDVKVVIAIKRNERLKRTPLGEFLIPKS